MSYDCFKVIIHKLLQGGSTVKIAAETRIDKPSVERIIARIATNECKRILPAILRLS